MSGKTGLTDRLDSGSVWGWLGGYVLAAWVVLQVTDTLASLIGLPLWFGKAVLALLAGGLVVVLTVAALRARPAPPGPAGQPDAPRLRAALTWRRGVALSVLAFGLLAVAAAGHMTARTLGLGPVGTLLAKGVLDPDIEIVLAELEDQAGDPGLARAATQALRVHLSQSPTVRLASAARVSEVLGRMESPPDAGLDLATGREVAIREGLRAVIGGEVHRVGSGYTVSVRLVAAESGAELLALLETARDPDDLIPAVERLSLRLRERIGESLASIRRSPPLSRVRTASLDALRSYTEGSDANEKGQFERCALLMDEAIALDSTFATAYVGRAACNQNLGRKRALQVSDRIRAFEMRDRMTEEERLRFTAIYHQFVTSDRRQAVEAWEAYAARYPDRPSPLFALANLYAEGREWERAETMLLRAMEADPARIIVLLNLAGFQTNLGRFDDARASFDRLAAAAPGLDLGWRRATLHLAAADWDAARSELERARERARGDAGVRSIVGSLQGLLAWTRGRADEAERLMREAFALDLETGAVELYHLGVLGVAELYLDTRGDTATAVRVLEDALAAHPLAALDPFERSYLELAPVLARAGRTGAARALITEWEREVAPLVPGSTVPHHVRAALAEGEGRWSDAIEAWRLEDATHENPLPALVGIGRAFDRLDRPDSAIAYYTRYLTTPFRLRYQTDPAWRALVLQRLGALHDARGEREQAARYYAMFVELWADADPRFQESVAAARSRLVALFPER
ncbi:MAG: tetratricopeptide repeat protein [Gammaproteobacteria bacterium]|nr:tetratricopeptide repeat protein [Gemmatimonadota bacterium]NIU77368.1 tetratricopeptide repeat protein [Gammaproteobacteria bacterium]NIY10951.1 tetratricopeptide repeat protein [Gemmatimonadota bacterium]